MSKKSPRRIAILGLTVSGNRGAESMLLAIMAGMREQLGPCKFDLLSVYPRQDAEQQVPVGLRIVPAKPLTILGLVLPASILALPFRNDSLVRRLLQRIPALESLLAADLVLDSSGVTFIDGRGLLRLLYNTALTLPPVLLGRPTVKLAQAMGPFNTILNRVAARFVLSRLECVIARGTITETHLDRLKLGNTAICADTAFAMPIDEAAETQAKDLLSAIPRGHRLVGISPSAVVEAFCARRGLDYASIVAALVHDLDAQGLHAVLIPHSLRPGSTQRMNNDALVCREILSRLPSELPVSFFDQELRAPVLRVLIGAMDLYVASRFHAMVSALATAVPVLLIGWSHKYTEVMRMFDLDEQVMGFDELTEEALCRRFRELVAHEDEIRARLASHLPAVIAAAKRNFTLAAAVLSIDRRTHPSAVGGS